MEISLTEENYLKAIFFISGMEGNLVNTNAIAERLDTKAATVTDMLRKLKQKELIHYQPYKGSRLSEEGQVLAIRILRKHRLWETFLVEKLGFGWEEVHEIAEQLEHVRSQKLTERLSQYLGNPQFDPHGDPIPDERGVFPMRENLTLDKASAGEQVLVKGVKDSSPDFLSYVAKLGIRLGDEMQVIQIEPFDSSVLVSHQGLEFRLSAMACSNIYISRI
ncbi:metal-dependent transcriptional regulator [Croceimicrobium sp.]|uniref:metal-dependent transcriptional regulator n=1 Tax=Croceimicrobium sp. TaxID=2828340 RepID=UPI003BAAF3F6